MTVNIILQARMNSSRLPGKVLMPILGQPILALQIARLAKVTQVNKLIIATSTEPSDDAIDRLCDTLNIACFRGNLNNVLDRYYQASLLYPSEHIVRITGDCPLIDAQVIDHVILAHLTGGFDYTNNCEPATFPDGLDVEVMTKKTLKSSWLQAVKPSELEHVTLFIRNHPEQFSCGSYLHECDLSAHRWTVDEQEDFELVERIYNDLYPKNNNFSFQDILKYLAKHPALLKINQDFTRNQGLLTSLKNDKEQGYA
ncbi:MULTISPECIES: cytidylyltransferase domain-containing protein [unclassified Colwellia]|jgi:spore coat polysaccharide biosynthesis protein SpsF|uniref:cytidylyltransferase domain-containing protein n=1 Tax=unclassified Colwellia TaxID=196834 RepID=UPI0015F6E124|nr:MULTISPECIES: glycosyltransferase family protein [unclassified Colwellia]MBA6253839.1 glycosyltransferase family protein [Colwellia sp. MB3u-55]MBA6396450.1 glycosyltransferase family protein [Colwellia sp. BRX10-4]